MPEFTVPTPGKAATDIAHMFRHGRTPTPEQELAARRKLALAHLDRDARKLLGPTHGLDGIGCAHIIGLILGASGVKYDAATLVEGIVRNAVEAAQDAEAQR